MLEGNICTPDSEPESEEKSNVCDNDSELDYFPDSENDIETRSKNHPCTVEVIELVSDEEGPDSAPDHAKNIVGELRRHPRAVNIIDLVSEEEEAGAVKRTRLYPRKCNFILTALMIWTHCLSAPGKKFTASGGIRLGSSIPRNPSSGHTIIDIRSEKEKGKGKENGKGKGKGSDE